LGLRVKQTNSQETTGGLTPTIGGREKKKKRHNNSSFARKEKKGGPHGDNSPLSWFKSMGPIIRRKFATRKLSSMVGVKERGGLKIDSAFPSNCTLVRFSKFLRRTRKKKKGAEEAVEKRREQRCVSPDRLVTRPAEERKKTQLTGIGSEKKQEFGQFKKLCRRKHHRYPEEL